MVRDERTGQATFYLKGADAVLAPMVRYNDWLEEECGNMAREGLRTLVVARKHLSEPMVNDFLSRYLPRRIQDGGLPCMQLTQIAPLSMLGVPQLRTSQAGHAGPRLRHAHGGRQHARSGLGAAGPHRRRGQAAGAARRTGNRPTCAGSLLNGCEHALRRVPATRCRKTSAPRWRRCAMLAFPCGC